MDVLLRIAFDDGEVRAEPERLARGHARVEPELRAG
jgi:hypothetical protein